MSCKSLSCDLIQRELRTEQCEEEKAARLKETRQSQGKKGCEE